MKMTTQQTSIDILIQHVQTCITLEGGDVFVMTGCITNGEVGSDDIGPVFEQTKPFESLPDTIKDEICTRAYYEFIRFGAEGKRLGKLRADKAEKWDVLHDRIGKFYTTENEGNEDEYLEEQSGDLSDIGEIAASAFGYL